MRGLAAANSLLDQLPGAARDQLGVELAIIAREILTVQRRLVAKDTGALQGELSLAVQAEQLRARIGLLGDGKGGARRNGRRLKTNLGDAFYGRIVEDGRRAQTVIVTRTARRQVKAAQGVTRRNRGVRKAAVVAKSYSMKVTALSARPFVHIPGAEALAVGQLAEFWSRTLARTGGGAAA